MQVIYLLLKGPLEKESQPYLFYKGYLAWVLEFVYNLANSLASSNKATTPLPLESAPNAKDCKQNVLLDITLT